MITFGVAKTLGLVVGVAVGRVVPVAGAFEVVLGAGVAEAGIAEPAAGLVGFAVVGVGVAFVEVAAGLGVGCWPNVGVVSSHKLRSPVGTQMRERSLIEEEKD
ncbi:hypothetical protein BXP70_17380 [Hymenobacter crusticola]|uniref:Uncharacterized protein n=1 Tax=Hymenobacter crusticola TaxID=1770526 RepID=A0A243WD36_9BACT|nr:hypothetical protein BXP70_17380 [Hymenobacter crusticola]